MRYYLGIDGGGTKTEAVLCREDGHILLRKVIAATNPNDIGIESALVRLCGLIEAAHRRLEQMSGDASISVFGGISGALNHRERLLGGLCEKFPNDLIGVHSDAVNLLSSELYQGDGCCLICGTGSVCFVRCGKEMMRIGGWGYLLDRAGSGFAIGREALEAAMRSHDGRGDATLLTGVLSQQLGGAPWDKLTEIYEGGKSYIASLAPCVLACADAGDRVAFEILYRQALYLAECLEAAYHHIGNLEPLEAVLGGGLFEADDTMQSLIRQNITVPVHLTVAQAPLVFGAVWEAVKLQSETVSEKKFISFRRAFMEDHASCIARDKKNSDPASNKGAPGTVRGD